MNKFLLLLCVLFVSFVTVSAQNARGTVLDEDQEPLIGVTVLIQGTNVGTVTDVNGNFEIAANQGDILQFSYVGYSQGEYTFNGDPINIVLSEGAELDEIVVVGYGSQRRSDAVGAIAVAGQKEFGNVATTDATQLITGKLAGVQVVSGNGSPGSGSRIVVRGIGSFSSSDPLYVIDGIQANSTLFNQIQASDIESITVLKDAVSTAIYGASASNGVVVVTTRQGISGEPRVNYSGYVGQASLRKKLDFLNAQQFGELSNVFFPDPANRPPGLAAISNGDVTDWQDEVFRNALVHENTLSVSGGAPAFTYNVSGGLLRQEGISGDEVFRRGNLRLALTQKVGKRVRLGQTLFFTNERREGQAADLVATLRIPSYVPVLDPDNLGGYSNLGPNNQDGIDIQNPVAQYALVDNYSIANRTYLQGFAEVDILKGLRYRIQGSAEYTGFSSYNFTLASRNGGLDNPNTARQGAGSSFTPLIENILTYDNSFGGIHTISLLGGNTWQDGGTFQSYSIAGTNFQNTDIRNIRVAGDRTVLPGDVNFGQGSQLSYFARVRYSLLDRYNIEGSFRRDGRPVFPENDRFGNFPGVGVSWEIDKEPFMADQNLFSSMRLRASYGRTGNASIRAFAYQASVTQDAIGIFNGNNVFTSGSTIVTPASRGLKWEETTQTDFGIDFTMLDYAFNFSVDFYNRQNDDLIADVPIAASTGFNIGNQFPIVQENAASAFNRGVEIAAGYNGKAGSNFTYYVNLNSAFNKNEVTALGLAQPTQINSGQIFDGPNITRTQIGSEIGGFYGYVVDGIARTQADVDRLNAGAPPNEDGQTQTYQNSFAVGDYIFKDLDGDGIITADDQRSLGSPLPNVTYGASAGFAFRGLDFAVALQGTQGSELVNGLRYQGENGSRLYGSFASYVDRFDPVTNPNGDIAQAGGGNNIADRNLRASDRYIEDGDYLRVRNITLGYALPASLTRGAFQSARLYVTAQNLITITRYSGYDPEVSAAGGNFLFGRGIDVGQTPQPRTLLVGLQFGL